MADDFQDKTEEASGKKLQDARKKGQVAKSQDLTAGIMLSAGVFFLMFFSATFFHTITTFMRMIFNTLGNDVSTPSSLILLFQNLLFNVALALLPYLLLLFVVSFLISALQVKLVFSVEPLIPKFEKVNIFDIKNYKKFFNITALMRLTFGLSKMAVVGTVCYLVIMMQMSTIFSLINATSGQMISFLAQNMAYIGICTALILVILGVADFGYQKWKFSKDMKMTHQEVKEERKQTEGNAQVKSRVRSMMQAFSQSRMKANVPKSDVVIANPVHFSVAIKYDPEVMAAPVCMAKGAHKMAINIKEIAKENNIPIVENPLLARSLYKTVDVGDLVPAELYHSVAEVLAYVYRLNEAVAEKDGASAGQPH
jgi:flagellar biosynthesis protein FlhB